MAATGNEVPTLDQLLMYVSYISDEDLDAYLNFKELEAGGFTITSEASDLQFSNTTCTVADDGDVTISSTISTNTWGGYDISYGMTLFSVPEEYAPSRAVYGTLTYGSTESYQIEITTQGVCSFAESDSLHINWNENWTVNLSYTLPIETPTSTGKEVVRLSQIKALLDSGGGGSSEPTWTTIFEGDYTCSNSGALEIDEDTSGYSKLRITAKYVQNSYEHDSGTFEFDNVDFDYQYVHTVGTFELYSYTFTVQMLKAQTGLNIHVNCSTSSYTRFCRITKIEVM